MPTPRAVDRKRRYPYWVGALQEGRQSRPPNRLPDQALLNQSMDEELDELERRSNLLLFSTTPDQSSRSICNWRLCDLLHGE